MVALKCILFYKIEREIEKKNVNKFQIESSMAKYELKGKTEKDDWVA
jgi:hypothetical protein